MLIGEKFYNAFASLRLTIVLTVHVGLCMYILCMYIYMASLNDSNFFWNDM